MANSTVKQELQKLGLDKLMDGIISYKEYKDNDLGVFHDIVCVETGNVYGFVESYHSNENEFFASDEASLNAFKNNLPVITE